MKRCREGYENIKNKLSVESKETKRILYNIFRLGKQDNLYVGRDLDELIEVIHRYHPVGINRFVREEVRDSVEITMFSYSHYRLYEDCKIEIRKTDSEILEEMLHAPQ